MVYHAKRLGKKSSVSRVSYRQAVSYYQNRRIVWYFRGIILLAAAIVIFIIYFLFFSGFFRLADVRVEGNQKISSHKLSDVIWKQAQKSRFLVFSQKNLFFLNLGKARNRLENEFNFRALTITKDYPRAVVIKAGERVPEMVWKTGERYYYADRGGMVVSEISGPQLEELGLGEVEEIQIKKGEIKKIEKTTEKKTNGLGLPVVVDESRGEVDLKKALTSQETISVIFFAFEVIPFQINQRVNEFRLLKPDHNELKIIMEKGYSLILNLEEDLSNQLTNFFTLLEKEKLPLEQINYIDLRFGDKVYYKYR